MEIEVQNDHSDYAGDGSAAEENGETIQSPDRIGEGRFYSRHVKFADSLVSFAADSFKSEEVGEIAVKN